MAAGDRSGGDARGGDAPGELLHHRAGHHPAARVQSSSCVTLAILEESWNVFALTPSSFGSSWPRTFTPRSPRPSRHDFPQQPPRKALAAQDYRWSSEGWRRSGCGPQSGDHALPAWAHRPAAALEASHGLGVLCRGLSGPVSGRGDIGAQAARGSVRPQRRLPRGHDRSQRSWPSRRRGAVALRVARVHQPGRHRYRHTMSVDLAARQSRAALASDIAVSGLRLR